MSGVSEGSVSEPLTEACQRSAEATVGLDWERRGIIEREHGELVPALVDGLAGDFLVQQPDADQWDREITRVLEEIAGEDPRPPA